MDVAAMLLVLVYMLLIGYFIAMRKEPDDPLAPLVFDALPGIMFLTVTSRLLHVAVANSGAADVVGEPRDTTAASGGGGGGDGGGGGGGGNETLANASAGDASAGGVSHGSPALVVLSMLCLLFYSSSAIFVGSYKRDVLRSRSDAVYVPVFRVKERMLKATVAVAAVATAAAPKVQLPIVLAAVVVMILMLLRDRPCSWRALDRLRVQVLLCALAILGCALANVHHPSATTVWFLLAAVAGGLVLVAKALFLRVKRQRFVIRRPRRRLAHCVVAPKARPARVVTV